MLSVGDKVKAAPGEDSMVLLPNKIYTVTRRFIGLDGRVKIVLGGISFFEFSESRFVKVKTFDPVLDPEYDDLFI